MAKKPKQNDNEFTFDDNSVKNRVGLKLFRAVLFTGLFYILGCFLLNFLILTVKGLNASGQITFKFKIDYLRVPPDGFSPVMLLMISLMVSMVVVIRLETTYRIKNENKSLKGKQRWMNDKELKDLQEIITHSLSVIKEKMGDGFFLFSAISKPFRGKHPVLIGKPGMIIFFRYFSFWAELSRFCNVSVVSQHSKCKKRGGFSHEKDDFSHFGPVSAALPLRLRQRAR